MKNFIKTGIFLIIFLIMFHYLFSILWLSRTPISSFYDEPDDSLDVVYVGASNAYAHFNAPLAYNLYGFTTGFMSTDSVPFTLIKYLIKEAKKYQNPKLYVVDIATLIYDYDGIEEGAIRKSIDSMKFSLNRIDAINDVLKATNTKKEECINYYFSFLKYHNKWNEIDYSSYQNPVYLYKGYFFSSYTIAVEKQKEYIWNDDVVKLPKKNYNDLIKLIEYIKDEDTQVLFVIPKRFFNENDVKMLNYATNIIEESGLQLINFNKLNDLDIDFSHDFYNYAHLNIFGATKYTLYFSKYLNDNYDLIDHRGDKKYNSWNDEYERFKKSFYNYFKYDFDELLSK